MPSLKTELTEIVTGLGMLGIECVDDALNAPPAEMLNVTTREFNRLKHARKAGEHQRLFEEAWENGQAFASSVDGLRNRKPRRVEWKGSHRPPGYEQVPADLRVDHVYLVSCKYRSKILYNASPAHLFDRMLTTRRGRAVDWYSDAAPDEYQNLYQACRRFVGSRDLPDAVTDLAKEHRLGLKNRLPRRWPKNLVMPYRQFCDAVSTASAQRWQKSLGTNKGTLEEMLWRLLRLQPAPYFILGANPRKVPMRFRVDTPWDFRQRYRFDSFEVEPDRSAGQPKVKWLGVLTDKVPDEKVHVKGHVEVRWSHGRFSGAPEAKVYLDTPYEQTPGYSYLR